MITDMFAKAKPTRFVLEQGGMPYGTPRKSSFVRAWQSPKW
jgi:hypothetical protein